MLTTSLRILSESWHKLAIASLESQYSALDNFTTTSSKFGLIIGTWLNDTSEAYKVDLQGLEDNQTLADDISKLEKVLDMAFPPYRKESLNKAIPVVRSRQDHMIMDPLEV